MSSNRSIVCLAALLVALSVFATPPPPALAQSDGPLSAASQLRQLQQYLKELRSRGRSRRWTDTSDLLVKMKRTFAHTTPELLTRISPEDLSHFSYALATLEEGVIAKDVEQLDQGFRLSRVAMGQLQTRFPGELAQEIEDLRQATVLSSQAAAHGDYVAAQDLLEDVAAGRRRLDNAGMTYGREIWVHYGLQADEMARFIRAHNVVASEQSAAGAQKDLAELQGRIPRR